MDDAHRSYDELDSPHDMACDCVCACENLHVQPGSDQHLTHLADCAQVLEICDLHIDERAVRLAESMHLHLD
ncbi:MAG: hypothetical protein R2731_01405 [Nocardioides sp.]